MFLWTAAFPCPLRREVIHDSVNPGITDDVKVMELIHQTCDTPFWISAVTKQEHLPVRADLIHSAAHHSCGNLQLYLLFVSKLVSQRDRQRMDPSAMTGNDSRMLTMQCPSR